MAAGHRLVTAPARPKTESPKGRARKDRLIEVATRLIARNGSRGTSLAEIAAEAGVTQGGLLYHFPTKEAMLNAVLDRRDEADAYFPWADDDEPGLDVVWIIARAVRHWSREADRVGMHSILVAESAARDSPLHARLLERYGLTVDRLARALANGQARGEIEPEVDPRLKAIEFIAFINGLETAWLIDPTIHAADAARQWATDQVRALGVAGAAEGLPPQVR